ncbi:hypothetical protein IE4771_PB00025 (plasmid) [Rhizobium etli bv. mimosae str. IE4771]|uniref:Uncharacterized protein n=1 Tax=Rhizobium etli bv. mimosae str. IE4771 TaxID=1432050 RepID=A0A060ICG1_RHIET|nr:hypothetical protein [Rhizobium sp. IE4771]AIC29760.1 hypothetical protein IE4771_PB00025 [Rhizobium sp. IE4771]
MEAKVARPIAQPIVSKSASYPFQVSIACWIDLLGYGGMIAAADFNPLHNKSREALRRLRDFHKIVASHSARHFPTLVMNDGAVAYRDLSLRSPSVTYDFLIRSWELFNEIKSLETAAGHPGARMVLACGFRMRGRRAGMDASAGQLRSILARLQEGRIDSEQAIREAASVRPTFDIIPQLQANFAFTKAYVAESSGKAGGIAGANFYVDLAIFDQLGLDWITLGEAINWSHPRLGLSADFASVLGVNWRNRTPVAPEGVRDGLQIAEQLTGDPNVLDALRQAKKI